MNEVEAFKRTQNYLKNLAKKTSFSKDEVLYINEAPLALLTGRFDYDKDVLSDFNFVYPIICITEKAIGELVSRVHDIGKFTYYDKLRHLILMHQDLAENDDERNLSKLKLKLSSVEMQEMFNFLIELKQLRNDISHLRFDSLSYKELPLSECKTRVSLLLDMFSFNNTWNAFRKDLLEKGRLPYK